MTDTSITPEKILAEIEQVIREIPLTNGMLKVNPDVLPWLGRATAVVHGWANLSVLRTKTMIDWNGAVETLHKSQTPIGSSALMISNTAPMQIPMILHQIQHDLRMTAVGPMSAVIDAKKPFQYFDELRRLLEQASSEVFMIDLYLDADVVASYMPFVKDGVSVRLLGSKGYAALKAAAEKYTVQSGTPIEVRENKNLHDRWLFIDKRRGFQSGASFKDGAKSKATAITETLDACAPMLGIFETMWSKSQP